MAGGISGTTGGVFLADLPLGNALTNVGGDVYVSGGFSIAGSHGAVGVARWDGTDWSALDDPKLERIGVNGASVEAIATDKGGAVYVGGLFHLTGDDVRTPQIARFDNGTWSPLGEGLDGRVLALAADAASVYAGGTFMHTGTVAIPRVARWDGSAWSALGAGLDGPVHVLVKGPEGSLYAGGDFSMSGKTTLNGIGVWNGTRWDALGSGLDGLVLAIAVDDQGKVYAGGNFTRAGGKDAASVALWDGAAWSSVGPGVNGIVRSLAFYDGKLAAGGDFRLAGDAKDEYSNLAAWDGTTWKTIGGGTHGKHSNVVGGVGALSVREGHLYAGGEFVNVGDGTAAPRLSATFLARWDGKAWSDISGSHPNDVVTTILATNDALWIGGDFTLIDQLRSNLIGRYVFGTP